MQFYRCKCGHSQSWGSMPPTPCTGCEKCGTTLARDPNSHRVPDDHKPAKRYDTHTGSHSGSAAAV